MTSFLQRTLMLAALPLAACSLSDPSLLDPLRQGVDAGETDAGDPMEDAGPGPMVDAGPPGPQPADRCGAADVYEITETTLDLEIDTTAFTNRTTVSCAPSGGNDAFFAVRVTGGDYWHFHLRTDPTDPNATTRDPVLYLLGEGCNPNSCAQSSQACQGNQSDEHFAFKPDAEGLWYIGIDDGNAGGGRYLLDAIRPQCGNDIAEHGESCDGQDNCRDCRWVLNAENLNERIPNDNFEEANFIEFPPSNTLTILGDVGGAANCIYPDVYNFNVPDGGATIEVNVLNGAGEQCTTSTEAPFQLELLNAAGTSRDDGVGGGGCPQIESTNLPSGSYFVRLTDQRLDVGSVQRYQLEFTLTPN